MNMTPAQLLDQAKKEHAMTVQAMLIQAKLKIMHDDIFPAHNDYGIQCNTPREALR